MAHTHAHTQGVLLDTLASQAVEGWRSSRYDSSVGALALLGVLGTKGLQARRLRLTGSEANALYKLEMLLEDVKGVVQAGGATHAAAAAAGGEGAAEPEAGKEGSGKAGAKKGRGKAGRAAAQEGAGEEDVGAAHEALVRCEAATRAMQLLEGVLVA